MTSDRPRAGWALWAPVAAAALVVGVVAANVSGTIPFDSDEANHANLALRQYQDLRDGLFTDFLRHSYRTGQFPFLHGWTLLPWFALLGATEFAARVAQCAAFVVGAAACGWAAFRASGGDRRAAAVAAGLFAGSPLLSTLSGLCMLETPGAAATAVTLAVFAEACARSGRAGLLLHAAAGAAALATWFIKLNYGLWIIPALAVGHLVRWLRAEDRRAALRDAAVCGGVIVVWLGLWYSSESQRAAFAGFLHNPSQAVSVERDEPSFALPGFSASNFLAYFGLVSSEFHAHWALGALVLVAFAWALRHAPRNPALAAAAACLLWTWAVLSMGFREYAMARFIASALPALWIVAACGAADALRRVPAREAALAGGAALAVLLGAQVGALPRAMASEYEVGDEFAPVFTWLEGAVPPRASVLAVGYTDHTSARTLEWRLGSRPGTAWREVNVVGLNAERIFESPRRFDAWMRDPRPWGAPDWTSLVLEFVPGPRYPDRDIVVPETLAMWREAVRRHEPRLVRAAERRFHDLDLTVVVWRDTAPPPHRGLR